MCHDEVQKIRKSTHASVSSLFSRSLLYFLSFFLAILYAVVLNPITFLCLSSPTFVVVVFLCLCVSEVKKFVGEKKCEHGKSSWEYDCCSGPSQVGPIPHNDFILDICQS